MKISILKEKDNSLQFELEGDYNLNMLCNALNIELWQDAKIASAGFHQAHPLTYKYKFIIETKKGTSPRDAVDKALKRIQKQADDFGKKAAKVL